MEGFIPDLVADTSHARVTVIIKLPMGYVKPSFYATRVALAFGVEGGYVVVRVGGFTGCEG